MYINLFTHYRQWRFTNARWKSGLTKADDNRKYPRYKNEKQTQYKNPYFNLQSYAFLIGYAHNGVFML